MMRWWTNEAYLRKRTESEEVIHAQEQKIKKENEAAKIDEGEGMRQWTFRVRAEVANGESVAVTGNCDSLGNWKHDRVFLLTKENEDGDTSLSVEITVPRYISESIHSIMRCAECSASTSALKYLGSDNIWSGSVKLPLFAVVEYRYVVMIIVDADGHRTTQKHHIVRRWETNRKPRIIPKKYVKKLSADSNVSSESEKSAKSRLETAPPVPVAPLEPEIIGYYDNKERIDRGWLTTETAIQLKLFNTNLQVWKSKLKGHAIFVKATPINLLRNSISQESTPQITADECISLETMDLTDKNDAWPVVEVAVLNQSERQFKLQDQFGRPFCPDEFMIFQILLHSPQSTAILLDFYVYPRGSDENDAPYHVGFSYILPNAMKNSEGQIIVPITSVRHRPIGEVTVEYLVVKPTTHYTCDLSFSLHRQWKESWHGLDVGHRGAGTSFRGDIKQEVIKKHYEPHEYPIKRFPEEFLPKDILIEQISCPILVDDTPHTTLGTNKEYPRCAEVRENTIASLKSAASHGADFVEFDVQLSRDLVPVLYHDFYVAIALKRKKQLFAEETIQLPVKDLSLEQLQRLKLFHVKDQVTNSKYSDDHLEEHQPFPTLRQALEILDPSVGFNIEIKWTMQLKDGTYELYHPFDLNLYLDTVLEVVLQHAGSRNIVFSCFHPDICSMIRLKQNKYPVMFLTQGITDKYPAYHDPRCQNVPMAVHYAVNMDILGINVHTEDLLRDSSQVEQVKRAGLVLFCWGDDNNDTATIKHLKELGIHAVIYDKIDQYGTKEVKESIFRLEAKEPERLQIRAAAERADKDEYLHPNAQSPEVPNKYVVEIEAMKAIDESETKSMSVLREEPTPSFTTDLN